LERTTGFEPATLTLAKNKSSREAQLAYLHLRKLPQHDRRFRLTRNRPLSTVVSNGACVFCAARTTKSCTTCTTSLGVYITLYVDMLAVGAHNQGAPE
jgi:hypothetical protein